MSIVTKVLDKIDDLGERWLKEYRAAVKSVKHTELIPKATCDALELAQLTTFKDGCKAMAKAYDGLLEDETKDKESYPEPWMSCNIHLNPETGEMHSDGNHEVRHWLEARLVRVMPSPTEEPPPLYNNWKIIFHSNLVFDLAVGDEEFSKYTQGADIGVHTRRVIRFKDEEKFNQATKWLTAKGITNYTVEKNDPLPPTVLKRN